MEVNGKQHCIYKWEILKKELPLTVSVDWKIVFLIFNLFIFPKSSYFEIFSFTLPSWSLRNSLSFSSSSLYYDQF